ncbi:MAG: hypothetical protein COU06_01760 [Candidatus Harrisonbacteria bacterium CG10_big_fil_rev_8_21_14_0_10_38_8]|uniref:VIT family protein n=1 Tax=Candidatus Harrisonbacteria bacterium CG10_big_fil_rev_8_21_14_0_10_38_8 TaxID=1974582 RepID=A0A2M6WJY1_9BACT|nr:MAG: hypothetical protein COU06_01760 [Candidatus Harrisonbacteria bacterium CG10_big_fil_rev_8_21_14_0_10_38_8]
MNDKTQQEKRRFMAFIRNFVYGVEDSLVSTVGLLSGVAISDISKSSLLLTGVVLIFVEAFSMSVGSYLSEFSAEEYMKQSGDEHSEHSFKASLIMFFSYFVSGFIPLAPYLILERTPAFIWSIALSIVALFILGIITTKFSKENMIKSGLRMAIVGGVAIGLGVMIGKAFLAII